MSCSEAHVFERVDALHRANVEEAVLKAASFGNNLVAYTASYIHCLSSNRS